MNVDGTTIKSPIATVKRSARDAWSKSPTEDGRGFLLGAEMTGKRVTATYYFILTVTKMNTIGLRTMSKVRE